MSHKLGHGDAPLVPFGKLVSRNGMYTFTSQGDGNLVLYKFNSPTALWASGTQHKGLGHLIMQTDGNLVAYNTNNVVRGEAVTPGAPFWASQTNGIGSPPYTLIMQDDGNLVIYDRYNVPIWATNTNGL